MCSVCLFLVRWSLSCFFIDSHGALRVREARLRAIRRGDVQIVGSHLGAAERYKMKEMIWDGKHTQVAHTPLGA